MNYIPLNIKTNYSLLKSLIDIPKLVEKCKKIGYSSIGIADENMFGVMEFYTECLKNDINPIIGLEIKIDNKKILLYAKSYMGYQNLCYISSNEKNIDALRKNSEDLFCILPYESLSLYEEIEKIIDTFVSYKNVEEKNNVKKYKNLYVNEITCLDKEDRDYLKYLYMIKDGKKIKDSKDYNFDDYNYLIDNDEFLEITLENCNNYKKIEESVSIKIEKREDLLPIYNDNLDFNDFKYLTDLCKKGLLKRFNNKVPIRYVNRLMYELNIINQMGFCNYFLVVWDFIKYSKKNNILVGPGRGSAVGSLVSYSLGITDIDPLKYNLIFERFLNPERVTMPDIDIDFEKERRGEVIKYVSNKYGIKNVSQIVTFSSLKTKQVLRDVFRIFDYDQDKADKFIKLFDSKLTLEENFENKSISEILKKDTLLSRIYDVCIHLQGLKRQTSIHAAGVIISSKQLDRYIPIYKSDGEVVAGYTMNYLENLGFLKMDFLSLDNLSLVSSLLKEIGNVDFNNIPLDDKKTIELFKTANTDGIFQFETLGMKNILRKFNVSCFEDLCVIIALFRPGPIDNIDEYIKRKNNEKRISYISEDLKPILEDTYGIIIYQEQIMQIANKMAGYSLGEADILRRAMSKKNHIIMEEEREKFVNRSVKNGYDKNVSISVYNLIYKFADFGFNKSHSVGYATLAFKMGYLKAHYSNYFISHLLTSVIGNDIKTKKYIEEAKSNDINILKPCINKSELNYVTDDNSILFSLVAIHNINNIFIRDILKERENGLFTDFLDFMRRCYNDANKNSIISLINAGCFDIFGYNHKTLIDNLDIAINYSQLTKKLDESLITKPEFDICEEYSKDELIRKEYETFGFYLSYHPVQSKRKNNMNSKLISKYFNKSINIYLLIDKINQITTKKGEKMAFVTASDEFGEVDIVIFPKLYESNYNINRGNIVLINGKVEKRLNKIQIIANKIEIV